MLSNIIGTGCPQRPIMGGFPVSVVLLEVLDLFHDLAEGLWTMLRRITIFNQANFNIEFKLVPDHLVVEPIGK